MQWKKIANVAMYYGANWDLMVCMKRGMTPESAQAYAIGVDEITFFFIATGTMVLEGHGTFSPGDAVFFSGEPQWGTAPNLADGYVKPSPANRLTETDSPVGNGWIYFESKIKVPQVTSPAGVIFAWPGLQPGSGPTYQPINNGVLQPVLTFGQGPYPNPNHVSAPNKWWISGQYVGGVQGFVPGGWVGGDVMVVAAGDELKNVFTYEAKTGTWTQTVTNLTAQGTPSVTFSLAMVMGTPPSTPQEQNRAIFCLENPNNGSLTQSVSIYDVVLKVGAPDATLGQDISGQPFVSGVSLKPDQTTLTIERVMIYNPVINTVVGTGVRPEMQETN